jgi:hypothetical protein
MQITIKTLKGATVNLTLKNGIIDADVEVGSKLHSFTMVKLARSAALGDFLVMGPAKAQISAETRDEIEKTIIAAQRESVAAIVSEHNAKKKEFLASNAGKAWVLRKKTERADSDM